ncbi:MAG: alpha/beta hydrolase fold domain-containing protein [Rubricoccaceae bacterium]
MPSPPEPAPGFVHRLRGALGRGLARLPEALLRRLPPVVVDGQTLDPSLRLLLMLRPARHAAPLTHGTPEAARARLRRDVLGLAGRPTPVGAVRELVLAAGLRARHYAPPAEGADAPLLVYFHGGGHVLGDLDTVDEPCRLLCLHGRQHVVSVAYRLAPEHPAPAGLEDALTALRWAQAHAARLGADPGRVAVGGDSAGANLAAVVAQQTRGDRPPAAQLLFYPPTDRTRAYRSARLFDGYLLRVADRDRFHAYYTAGTGIPPEDPRVSPLCAPRLGGLPPALVVVAGFDVLRDEAEAYGAALRAAGVPAEVVRETSMPHGFLHLTSASRAARAAAVGAARRWRRLLDRYVSAGHADAA